MGRQVVWKQELNLYEVGGYNWPEGAEVINVASQRERVCVWFRCDPDRPLVARRLAVVGTGHREVDPSMVYLGTAHFNATTAPLVLHVFEVP